MGSSCSAKAAAAACRPLLHAVDDRGSERRRDAGETGDAVLARGADCEDLVDIPVLPPFARAGGGHLTLFRRYVDVENVGVCRVGGTKAAQADLVRASVCGRVRRWKSDMATPGATASVGGRKERKEDGLRRDGVSYPGCVTKCTAQKVALRPLTDCRSSSRSRELGSNLEWAIHYTTLQ